MWCELAERLDLVSFLKFLKVGIIHRHATLILHTSPTPILWNFDLTRWSCSQLSYWKSKNSQSSHRHFKHLKSWKSSGESHHMLDIWSYNRILGEATPWRTRKLESKWCRFSPSKKKNWHVQWVGICQLKTTHKYLMGWAQLFYGSKLLC